MTLWPKSLPEVGSFSSSIRYWRSFDQVKLDYHQIRARLRIAKHNYITLLYEAGVDPLVAMKIAGHSDYQTTAGIYTHIRDEMLKKSTVNMGDVFRKREEE